MEGFQVKQVKLAPRKPLSEADFETLLAACRNERDRAMLIVTLECGLRVSELTGLRVEDIDLNERVILVRGKGDKERWLGLSERAVVALRPFVITASDFIWFTKDGKPMNAKRAKRNMEEIEKRARVHAHYHRLRTTFAHNFLHATHDLDSLQTLMGHSDANTTRRYAAYGAQQRALEQMRRFSNPLL
jgi:integrase/recombinase XerD